MCSPWGLPCDDQCSPGFFFPCGCPFGEGRFPPPICGCFPPICALRAPICGLCDILFIVWGPLAAPPVPVILPVCVLFWFPPPFRMLAGFSVLCFFPFAPAFPAHAVLSAPAP